MNHWMQNEEKPGPNCIAASPVVHQEENDGSGNQGGSDMVPFLATLSLHPKDLYTLWQEYEFGWYRREETCKAVLNGRESQSKVQVLQMEDCMGCD
jgi:hypothetical protein